MSHLRFGFITIGVFKFSQFKFWSEKNCQWKTIIVKTIFWWTSFLLKMLYGKNVFFGEILFWWLEFFGHYCHNCHYSHYCHYCHYRHYYHIGRKKGRYRLPFDTLKVNFSQKSTNRPTGRQTEKTTTRLVDLLLAVARN